jgi:hypothetical protein
MEAEMTVRMGVKEFRANFTTIARDAQTAVVVTSHDKVVGYYTPARRDPDLPIDWDKLAADAQATRKKLERAGVDVAGRLKALGIEDDAPFEDPWTEGKPARSTAAKKKRRS